MPAINPASSFPQYTAGTDGRMRLSGLNSSGVDTDGGLVGSKVPLVSITSWKYTRRITPRPSTVTAESPAEPQTGVVDKTHLRRGSIRTTEFSGSCLVRMNAVQRVTDVWSPGSEAIADFIFDKESTLGHHGCVVTINSFDVTGLNTNGDTECSWTAELNGQFPGVTTG